MNEKRIAIVDPSSYSLPYDYFYILELQKYYKVDFYCSRTQYNYEYIESLKKLSNVRLYEYNISTSVTSKVKGIFNYVRLLINLSVRINVYRKINFLWSAVFFLELPVFSLIKHKLIFTFHNDKPHSYGKSVYFPYKIISKLAKKVIFVSRFTQLNFIKNYKFNDKSYLLQHGILPLHSLEYTNSKNTKIEKKVVFWGRVERYKGLDIFKKHFTNDFDIEIFGKWDESLSDLKNDLVKHKNINVYDKYLDYDELQELMTRELVFILPYKSATQSGVLYTYLAHEKVFISSDAGENGDFLRSNGLSKLVFDRDSSESIKSAVHYAFENYSYIKKKMIILKEEYQWNIVMSKETLTDIFG